MLKCSTCVLSFTPSQIMIFGEFSLSSTAFALDFQGCSIFVCGMCLCGHLNLCVLQKVH